MTKFAKYNKNELIKKSNQINDEIRHITNLMISTLNKIELLEEEIKENEKKINDLKYELGCIESEYLDILDYERQI